MPSADLNAHVTVTYTVTSTIGLIEKAIESLAGQHTPETNRILELLFEARDTQIQVEAAYREHYKKMLRGGA